MGFGDNVKIKNNSETENIGIAGLIGVIYGETIPSVTHINAVGTFTEDYAYNVFFVEKNQNFWLPKEYLEFIDHGAGATITIGNTKLTRDNQGNWVK